MTYFFEFLFKVMYPEGRVPWVCHLLLLVIFF